MKTKPKITGRWRIIEMELWDTDAVDLLGPAFIEFGKDQQGSFRFLPIEGWMDLRSRTTEDPPPSSSAGRARTRWTTRAVEVGLRSPTMDPSVVASSCTSATTQGSALSVDDRE